jgi:UDP-N-acetylmuramoyl-tripeptide--D-alanyl-D-alanine ligase
LGSVEAIAEEKNSLFQALPSDGFAVLDADSEWFPYMQTRCDCRRVTVSLRGPADYQGEGNATQLKIFDRQRDETFTLPLPLPGIHMQCNLLQAVAMVRECGLSVEDLRRGLLGYAPAPMRWQSVQLKRWRIINDAYNANPLSMRKSIHTFAELDHPGEKWLVLGGMYELGQDERKLHVGMGEELDRLNFDGVILVGEKGAWMGEGITRTPMVVASGRAEAVEILLSRVPADALLLLKASRSERLELILEDLQKSEENEP